MGHRKTIQRTCVGVLAAMIAAGAAHAQTSDVADPQAGLTAASVSPLAIDEIVVTATKRATSLQDTAIAITAIQAEEMAFRDISGLADMQNMVPNMQYGDVGGVPMIAIRGVGFNLDIGFGEPGVAIHVDNVFLPRLGSASAAGIDMQRIEVLRGPQGTLYGRNATGGAANFISTAPTEDLSIAATIGTGSFQRLRGEASVSGAVTDWARARLYIKTDQHNGPGINEVTGNRVGDKDMIGLRGAVSLDLAAALTLDLSLYHRVDESALPAMKPARGTTVSSAAGIPYPAEDAGVRGSTQNISDDRDPYTKRETTLAVATLAYDGGGWSAKSVTGFVDHHSYENYSVDGTKRFIIDGERDETSKAFSQEFDFAGSLFEDQLDWLFGLYYLQDKGDSNYVPTLNADEVTGVISTPSGLVVPIDVLLEDQKNQAGAVFGEVSYRFLDDFKLLVGARYSEETKEATQTFTAHLDTDEFVGLVPFLQDQLGDIDPLLAPLVDPLVSQAISDSCSKLPVDVSFSSFDPKVELSWEPDEDTLVYAQYQTAFKAGGIDSSGCGKSYVPEEISSYEVGFKSSFLDGRLVANAAAFLYRYKNFQVFEFVGLGAQILNAPKASGRGGELELRYAAAEWLGFDTALSYLDAYYDEFSDADGFDNPNLFLRTAEPQDLAGNPLNRAPKYTMNFGVNAAVPLNVMDLSLRMRGEVYHSDTVHYTQFAPDKPTDRQEAYTLFNAYMALSSERYGFALQGFVKNITDEDYLAGVFPIDLFHMTLHSFAPPRTFGLELSYQFN